MIITRYSRRILLAIGKIGGICVRVFGARPQPFAGGSGLRMASDQSGATLIEMIVSIMVLSIIMASVTAVFLLATRAYERVGNLSEANALLDSFAALIMGDVDDATEITPGSGFFTVKTTYAIVYYINDDGILCRRAPGMDRAVFHRDLYKRRETGGEGTVFTIGAACAVERGLVTVTLTLVSCDGWEMTRAYNAKPVGL